MSYEQIFLKIIFLGCRVDASGFHMASIDSWIEAHFHDLYTQKNSLYYASM